MLNFIKEKSYYILGGIVVLLIVLILIASCSNKKNSKNYDQIEQNMIIAAKKYFDINKNKLPKEDNNSSRVNISSLVEAELLDTINDPNGSGVCTGYVEVTKNSYDYSYIPFLTCGENYSPKYLTDMIKNTKKDEYGNGVYEEEGEYIYKGNDLNNYVLFNNQLWRIIKIDSYGDIKLISSTKLEDDFYWDTAYNTENEYEVGITTNYLLTDIRKSLNNYYKNNFDENSKNKIVSKEICVGPIGEEDELNIPKECLKTKEGEMVSLINVSDFIRASLSEGCKKVSDKECDNYNFLSSGDINTWTLNPNEKSTFQVFYVNTEIGYTYSNSYRKINPVIYLTKKSLISSGKGTVDEPYVVK